MRLAGIPRLAHASVMKTLSLAVCALLPAASLAAQGAPAPRLGDVAWLQGCWVATTPGRVIEENWTAPRGGSMIGISRTITGDSLAGYEMVILRQRDSTLEYEAHPSAQPVATFNARTASATGVVFENPMHDFPQRVGYRRVGQDSLVAYIEGVMGGRNRRLEFPYARTRCSGP
jgi:hypothetical protein